MNKSISNSNYSKKVPAPNENRFKNNNNYNDKGYIDNDVKDSTINKYNNKINNKNKYLLSSKTSNLMIQIIINTIIKTIQIEIVTIIII